MSVSNPEGTATDQKQKSEIDLLREEIAELRNQLPALLKPLAKDPRADEPSSVSARDQDAMNRNLEGIAAGRVTVTD